MDSLLTLLFVLKILITLGLSCIYLSLYRHDRSRYLALWSASWSLYALRLILDIGRFTLPDSPVTLILNGLNVIVTTLCALLLVQGMLLFIERKMSRYWTLAAFLAAAVTAGFLASTPSLQLAAAPVALYFGASNIWCGLLMLNYRVLPAIGRIPVGLALLVIGLVNALYPFFLAELSSRSTLGMLSASLFDFIIMLGTLMLYFTRVRLELGRSEERYRLLVDNAQDVIFRYRTAHPAGLDYISPAITALTGYTPEEFYQDNDLIPRLTSVPDQRNQLWPIRDLLSQTLVQFTDRNGMIHWVENNSRPVYDTEGQLAAIEGILRDITERRKIEYNLRDSEDRLRRIVEMIADDVWEINAQSQVTYISPRQSRNMMDRQEYYNSSPMGHVAPEDASWVEALTKEMFENPKPLANLVFRMISPSGRTVVVETNCVPRYDQYGRFSGFIGVSRDITNQKAIEERAAHRNRQVLLLNEVAADTDTSVDLSTLADSIRQSLQTRLDIKTGSLLMYDGSTGRFSAVTQWHGTAAHGIQVDRLLDWIYAKYFVPGQPPELDGTLSFSAETAAMKTRANLFEPFVLDLYGQAFVLLPLQAENELQGILCLHEPELRYSLPADLDFFSGLGRNLGVAVRKARLFQELTAAQERLTVLSHNLLVAQETERRAIARELHDEIGQSLTAIKLSLQSLAPSERQTAAQLDNVIIIVDRLLTMIRNLSLLLRPSILDDLGLEAALRWHLDQQRLNSGLECTFESDLRGARLTPDLETTCFRVVQEAVNNTLRHANARTVRVSVSLQSDRLKLVIADDGQGFDFQNAWLMASMGKSFGLLGMKERVLMAGGRLDIESSPLRGGTTIRAFFPLSPIPNNAIGGTSL